MNSGNPGAEQGQEAGEPEEPEDDPYGDDIEAKQPVLLRADQLLARLLDNSFQEVKWSGAAALGLLRDLADRHYPGQAPELTRDHPESPVWHSEDGAGGSGETVR